MNDEKKMKLTAVQCAGSGGHGGGGTKQEEAGRRTIQLPTVEDRFDGTVPSKSARILFSFICSPGAHITIIS